jgi:5,10-methylenetetrahydromethanopterin reductase
VAIAPVLGLSLYCPPEDIAAQAAVAEEVGFDEIWLGEDFFDSGGIAAAALALGATHRLTIGLGVLSAAVRAPALLAMELAALGRAHPGRLIAGIGLGEPASLGMIGQLPESPLALVRECVTTVRSLLDGGRLVGRGGDLALAHPAPLPIHVGAVGPRMLRLAGEVGDGTVLSVGSGPTYTKWATARIAEGRRGNLGGHRVTVLAFISMAATREEAYRSIEASLAGLLAKEVFRPVVRYSGLGEEATAAATEGPTALRQVVGPDWVNTFAVVGDPTACVKQVRALQRAGADSVVLCPWGDSPVSTSFLARELLPALRAPATG